MICDLKAISDKISKEQPLSNCKPEPNHHELESREEMLHVTRAGDALPYHSQAAEEKAWEIQPPAVINAQQNTSGINSEMPPPPLPTQEGIQLFAQMLKEEMVVNAPLDQQKLLSRASFDELLAIRRSYSHPLIKNIVEYVRTGEWESLIRLTREDPKLPIYNILKAAYCQGKLGAKDPSHEGIDNLASAYIFLGPAMAGQAYKIYHFDEVAQHPEIWEDISNRWEINDIPMHQRYFILVEAEAYHPESRSLMEALHEKGQKNEVAGGLRYLINQGWALGSAGLIRNDHLIQGCPPVYGRSLRPIKERFEHLRQCLFEMMLDEPTDKQQTLHGAPPQGNLARTHDGYHAVRIVRNTLKYPELLSQGEKLYDILLKKTIPKYSHHVKSQAFSNTIYNMLMVKSDIGGSPTLDDWIRFFVYETVVTIQDGEAYYAKPASDSIKYTLRMIYNRQRMMYKECGTADPPLYAKLIPALAAYLKPLDILLN